MVKDSNAPWKNEELLRQKYWDEEMRISDIAEECGCSYHTVYYWMDKHGIERRGKNGSNKNAKHREADVLKRMYHEEKKTLQKIANDLDTTYSTIRHWMDKHGIERRGCGRGAGEAYRDKETLEELYVERGLSCAEIAEELNTIKQNVLRWLHKHDLPVRNDHAKIPHYFTRKNGYEVVRDGTEDKTVEVRIHRLVAIAEGWLEPTEATGRENHVHHKNGVPWDNRPENLEVLTESEHMSLHANS